MKVAITFAVQQTTPVGMKTYAFWSFSFKWTWKKEYFQFCHSRVQSFIGLLEGGGRAQDMPPLRHKTLPSHWLACLWWHSGRICGWSHAEPARLQVSPGPHPDWWSRTVACSCCLPSWEGCVAAVVHSDPCLLPPAAGYRTEKSKWLIEIVDWWVVSQN